MRKSEVMETERRGFCNQQNGIHLFGNGHGGAADAGRRVKQDVSMNEIKHAFRAALQGTEQRRRHGLAYAGPPHEKSHAAVQNGSFFQNAEFAFASFQGLCGTDEKTASATMAQIGENSDPRGKLGYGPVAADSSAGSAARAGFRVQRRNFKIHLFLCKNGRGKKKVKIGRLHVRIHSYAGLFPYGNERCRNGRFTRSALSAGNGDFHGDYLLGASANAASPCIKRSTASRTVMPSRS